MRRTITSLGAIVAICAASLTIPSNATASDPVRGDFVVCRTGGFIAYDQYRDPKTGKADPDHFLAYCEYGTNVEAEAQAAIVKALDKCHRADKAEARWIRTAPADRTVKAKRHALKLHKSCKSAYAYALSFS